MKEAYKKCMKEKNTIKIKSYESPCGVLLLGSFGGTNQASVTINPNFSGNTLTMNGYLVPYNESSVFQGTTW